MKLYDFEYIKNFGESYYIDFSDLLNDFKSNSSNRKIVAATNMLFERILKIYLNKLNIFNYFFPKKPEKSIHIFDLLENNLNCKAFIEKELSINTTLINENRKFANDIKHNEKNGLRDFDAKLVFKELVSVLVQINNKFFKPSVLYPSNDDFNLIFSNVESATVEINELLETKKQLTQKVKNEKEKYNKKVDRISKKVTEKQEINKKLQQEIDDKNKEICQLDEEIKKKVVEFNNGNNPTIQKLLDKANSYFANSDYDDATKLYENVINLDITNFNAFLGLIYCSFRVKDEEQLVLAIGKNWISFCNNKALNNKKFLSDKNRQDFESILNKAYSIFLIAEMEENAKSHRYDIINKLLNEAKNANIDSSIIEQYKTFVEFEPVYEMALKHKANEEYLEAIALFKRISNYKNSRLEIDDCETLHIEFLENEAVELFIDKKYLEAAEIYKQINNEEEYKHCIQQDERIKKDRLAFERIYSHYLEDENCDYNDTLRSLNSLLPEVKSENEALFYKIKWIEHGRELSRRRNEYIKSVEMLLEANDIESFVQAVELQRKRLFSDVEFDNVSAIKKVFDNHEISYQSLMEIIDNCYYDCEEEIVNYIAKEKERFLTEELEMMSNKLSNPKMIEGILNERRHIELLRDYDEGNYGLCIKYFDSSKDNSESDYDIYIDCLIKIKETELLEKELYSGDRKKEIESALCRRVKSGIGVGEVLHDFENTSIYNWIRDCILYNRTTLLELCKTIPDSQFLNGEKKKAYQTSIDKAENICLEDNRHAKNYTRLILVLLSLFLVICLTPPIIAMVVRKDFSFGILFSLIPLMLLIFNVATALKSKKVEKIRVLDAHTFDEKNIKIAKDLFLLSSKFGFENDEILELSLGVKGYNFKNERKDIIGGICWSAAIAILCIVVSIYC